MKEAKPYKLQVHTDVANYSEQEKWVAFSITLPCGNRYIGEYHWGNNKMPEIIWDNDGQLPTAYRGGGSQRSLS